MESSVTDVSLGRHVLRRHVNERISASISTDAQVVELFCECGRRACALHVIVELDDYAAVRAVPGRYIVAAAHADGCSELDGDHAVADWVVQA